MSILVLTDGDPYPEAGHVDLCPTTIPANTPLSRLADAGAGKLMDTRDETVHICTQRVVSSDSFILTSIKTNKVECTSR